MKKRNIIFLALCAMMLITGCGEKHTFEQNMKVFENAVQSNKDVTSGEITVNLEMSLNQDGVNVDINAPVSILFEKQNDTVLSKLAIGENPFIGKMATYLNIGKDNVKIFFPSTIIDTIMQVESEEINWYLLETSLEDVTEKEITTDEVTEKISNINVKDIIKEENLKYVDTNEDVDHYQFVITKGLIERLALALEATEEDIAEIDFDSTFAIDIYVNAKTDAITKIDFNLLNLIEDTEEASAFNKFNFTIEFKNMNSTVVEIPSDVINNAINLGLDDILGNIEEEVDYDFSDDYLDFE